MVDNSKNRRDKKNQKNKNEASERGDDIPRLGETVTLHDAAIGLAAVAPSKKGEIISDGKLLRALKSGEVQAGFHCSIEPLIWISIPTAYWLDITSGVFRRIRVSPDKKNRTGVFSVTITDFSKQYFTACIRAASEPGQELSPEWMIRTFEGAMARIESTFEVEIPKENWERYLSKQAAIWENRTASLVPKSEVRSCPNPRLPTNRASTMTQATGPIKKRMRRALVVMQAAVTTGCWSASTNVCAASFWGLRSASVGS